MTNIYKPIIDVIMKENIPYALLDAENNIVRILISNTKKNEFSSMAHKNGWKKIKDKSKDIYLYGMDHFMYYAYNDVKIEVCCQLACRSTLNKGWVPLDRMINIGALDRVVCSKEDKVSVLSAEDFLCYILGKCVYTDEKFSNYDIDRIEKCLNNAEDKLLRTKLQGVFFNFTDELIEMLNEKKYDDLIDALWCYANY